MFPQRAQADAGKGHTVYAALLYCGITGGYTLIGQHRGPLPEARKLPANEKRPFTLKGLSVCVKKTEISTPCGR